VAEVQRLDNLEAAAAAADGGAPAPAAATAATPHAASRRGRVLAREIRAVIVDCEGLTDAEMYRATLEHLAAPSGRLPAPSQIAWVSPETGAAAVVAFVRRRSRLPGAALRPRRREPPDRAGAPRS